MEPLGLPRRLGAGALAMGEVLSNQGTAVAVYFICLPGESLSWHIYVSGAAQSINQDVVGFVLQDEPDVPRPWRDQCASYL